MSDSRITIQVEETNAFNPYDVLVLNGSTGSWIITKKKPGELEIVKLTRWWSIRLAWIKFIKGIKQQCKKIRSIWNQIKYLH